MRGAGGRFVLEHIERGVAGGGVRVVVGGRALRAGGRHGAGGGAGVVLPYSETAQEQYGLPAELRLETTPERIIVMTLGPTEILHELGVELLAVPDTIDESQAWTQDLEAGGCLSRRTAWTPRASSRWSRI